MRRKLPLAALALVTLIVTAVVAQQSGSTIATDRIFEALQLRPGHTVCEMGAGDGELSLAAARLVGPDGRVYTSELGDERVRTLRKRVAGSDLPQVTVVEGHATRTNFPDATCDALFMRNVYHHFADPAAINTSIAAALKPGGRLAIVDFSPTGSVAERPEDRAKDGSHGVTAELVTREVQAAGFTQVGSETGSNRWFMVVFARPGP